MGGLDPFGIFWSIFKKSKWNIRYQLCLYKLAFGTFLDRFCWIFWGNSRLSVNEILHPIWRSFWPSFFDMMMCFVTISAFEIKLAYYDDNFGVIFWRVWSIFYCILSTKKLRDNSKLQDTIYQKSWKLLHNTSNIGQQSQKLHQKYDIYYR